MLVRTSLLSPKMSVNDFCSFIVENQTAVQRHSAIIDVLAAFMSNIVLPISLAPPKNVHQQSVNAFWSCNLENQWAMQLHQLRIIVLAAFMGKYAMDDIATTS